jgi:glycosyltransferase involved in cell wall biosynthesis
MSTPAVTFIVPCYNASRYVPEFCESLLAQTFRDFEVLIGDDGSTDDSIQKVQPFLRDPRFRLISWRPNRGMHAGVLFLLNAARGQYWCPPGTDDLLAPTFLEKRLPKLAARPEAVLIHGGSDWMDEHGQPLLNDTTQRALPELGRRMPESVPAARMLRVLLQHNVVNWPSSLARMDITRQVLPYFSPHWIWAMDWMLWILLAATGHDFLFDPEPLIRWRVHSQSLSASPEKMAIRLIERKLMVLHALRTAAGFSILAKSAWIEHRRGLYRWWLTTAVASLWRGCLTPRDLSLAAEAYRGALPGSVRLWRELVFHGFPALLQYRRERRAMRQQLFTVSGWPLIGDPLFIPA